MKQLVIVFLLIAFPVGDLSGQTNYRIENGSRLYLKGSSNVNQFTCDCWSQFPDREIEIEKTNTEKLQFRKAQLKLRISSFDCHNSRIDADMQKALNAKKHPHIYINLKEAYWSGGALLPGKNKQVSAKTLITINGETRVRELKLTVKSLSEGRLKVKGEKWLAMSDFGVAPPTALFGLIQVEDAICIRFDFTVQLY